VLAPISHAGTYTSASVGRNVREMIGRPIDRESVREILRANPELRREMHQHIDDAMRERMAAYEMQIAGQREQLTALGQWREEFDRDFPCMLMPATVISRGSATPYERSRLLRMRKRTEIDQFVTTRELLTYRPTAPLGEPAVLSGTAVVGRIRRPGAWTAQLQLITDADFLMQAFVHRTVTPHGNRQVTIAGPGGVPESRPLRWDDPWVPVDLRGRGDCMATDAVPARHGIEIGDYVLTRGDDRRLPIGVVIGKVAKVHPVPDSPKHVTLEVAPSADLEHLRDVYIVVPRPPEAR
jgi:hypothetical protein